MKKSIFYQSIWAITLVTSSYVNSQTMNIQNAQGIQYYNITQISSIVPRVDSTIYNLVGGGRYAAVTTAQKWTFSKIVATDKKGFELLNPNFSVQNNLLNVTTQSPCTFKLSSLNGSILAESKSFSQSWNTELKTNQTFILQIQNKTTNQSFLINN